MNVSIVIPVYNEAESLFACLQAIAAQIEAPYEVIVIDNNSTDDGVSIAKRFDFVTVICESKQGVMHARTLGFNHASGEIIARIDADSIIPMNWVQSVKNVFESSDADAVSGAAGYYNVAFSDVFNTADLFIRKRLSVKLGDRNFLWGANMAIKRSSWDLVKAHLCTGGAIHEDFDIGIHLQELGGNVTFDESLRAEVSSRRVDMAYSKFINYAMASPRTYAAHGISDSKYMYPVVLLCALAYFPAMVLYKGYDPLSNGFSLAKLISPAPSVSRIDPTTNVV